LQEIMGELGALTSTHKSFQAQCEQTKIQLSGTIQNKNSEMDKELASAIAKESGALGAKTGLTQDEEYRKQKSAKIAESNASINKKNVERATHKARYEQDMGDFNKALSDLDNIKNVLVTSQSYDAEGTAKTDFAKATETTGATGFLETVDKVQSSFLETVDKVQSDYFKGMTNRLRRAGALLENKENAVNGIDKLMKLIYQIRNELWQEMDELTKIEKESIVNHLTWLDSMYRHISSLKQQKNDRYRLMGRKLKSFAKYKVYEAHHYIAYAKARKVRDRAEIDLFFALQECNSEHPLYAKASANKADEIETIEQMIKILRELNWSGAVYSAISRIGAGGADENPEPGFKLALQMDLKTGLTTGRYFFTEAKAVPFSRLAVKLVIGDTWGWASFDKWGSMTKLSDINLPTLKNGRVQQRKVTNFNVFALKRTITPGKHAEGNLEIWADDYQKENFLQIDGASDGYFDFGDKRDGAKKRGSFQIHDFKNKQTVLAVNNWCAGNTKHDIGLGTQPQNKEGTLQPDWTGADNFQTLKEQQQLMTLSWYIQPSDWQKSIKHTGQGQTTTTSSPTSAKTTTSSPTAAKA